MDTRTQILAMIEELQMWFARKPYGWTRTATPDMLRQYEDRERELESLLIRLEMMGE